jgi:hypothetical protein
MQRGAPAVSDWCVAMGGDSALYARAHPTLGSVSIRTAPYKRNRSGKRQEGTEKAKPSRFDRESEAQLHHPCRPSYRRWKLRSLTRDPSRPLRVPAGWPDGRPCRWVDARYLVVGGQASWLAGQPGGGLHPPLDPSRSSTARTSRSPNQYRGTAKAGAGRGRWSRVQLADGAADPGGLALDPVLAASLARARAGRSR